MTDSLTEPVTESLTVTVRFFAAAREAAGVDEQTVELADGATIANALEQFTGDARAAAVYARSSFLVDGIASTDRDLHLGTGAVLDVLPPFAGG